jgi:GT2 family glycosyltransferase
VSIHSAELTEIINSHTRFLKPRTEDSAPVNLNTSRVSIIVPSFNQGCFLERTILSVLNQDWPAIELIVVDGGSSDDSLAIIRKYAGNFAWWVSEPDSGQTNAINKGLKRATGDYVTWLCSDDILLPGAVRCFAEALDAHPLAGMVFAGAAFIDAADRVLKFNSYPEMSLDRLLYHKHANIAQPASLLRKATLDLAGGLDESLDYCMDYDLWIRMHQHASSLNLGERVLAGYRLHDNSKTVGGYTRMALEKIRVNRRHTGNIINKVIYAHYKYIVEGWLRNFKKGFSR